LKGTPVASGVVNRLDSVMMILCGLPLALDVEEALGAGAAGLAPLNPAYRADEFEFYLSDLNAKALIVERDSTTSPAIAVARGRWACAMIELAGRRRPALHAATPARRRAGGGTPAARRPGAADDVSMVLHTSGTTSRPKIVPLSQGNLCASAGNIRGTLQFTAQPTRPEHHAAVPHPRPDRRRAGAAGGGLAGVLHAGLQCAEVLRLDGRGQPHLVHRRAHHAPGHPDARAGKNQDVIARQPAALHAQRQQRCRRRSSASSKRCSARR
jgi:hypothetical protein